MEIATVDDKHDETLRLLKRKRPAVNLAADELIRQLQKRHIDIQTSTAVLCVAAAIAEFNLAQRS